MVSGYCFVGSLSWTVYPRTEGSSPLGVFPSIRVSCGDSFPKLNILWPAGRPTATRCGDQSFGVPAAGDLDALAGALDALAGGLGTWTHSMDDLLTVVRLRLAGHRRVVIDDPRMRRAAVLLPLFEERGEGHVLFTRRTDTVEHHKGQISLPGGSEDASDQDARATALRETEEELGIPPAQVEILGALDDVYTVVSGFVITPFVGMIPYPIPLRVNPREIAEVLTVPLSTFRDPGRLRVEEREREGERIKVYFYYHGRHEIWGATGRIMKDFIETVFGEAMGEGPS